MKKKTLTMIALFLVLNSFHAMASSNSLLTPTDDPRVKAENIKDLADFPFKNCPVEVFQALEEYGLADFSPSVRTQTILTLIQLAQNAFCKNDSRLAVLSLIRSLENDESPLVRAMVLKSRIELDQIQSKTAEQMLQNFKNYSAEEKIQLCNTLEKLDAPEVEKNRTLTMGQKDSSVSVSRACSRTLHRIQFHQPTETNADANTTEPEKAEVNLKTLIFGNNDIASYKEGFYRNYPKIFILCRKSRAYPCLSLIQQSSQELLRTDSKQLWTMPFLLMSRYELPYHTTNGNTPQGIYEINAVMPDADRQNLFGKNRRLIMDFPERGPELADIKKLIPAELENTDWIYDAMEAEDNGRNSLRIHGTGMINDDPTSSFYPFIQSSGCIKAREGQYPENTTYNDQRIFLDTLMNQIGLETVFENETKIYALLYVLELDNQKKSVALADLTTRGIE